MLALLVIVINNHEKTADFQICYLCNHHHFGRETFSQFIALINGASV